MRTYRVKYLGVFEAPITDEIEDLKQEKIKMKTIILSIRFALIPFIMLAAITPASAKSTPYQTGFYLWRAAGSGFSGWVRVGARLDTNGDLLLDPTSAETGTDPYPAGGYYGGNYYNGATFQVGEATSPVMPTDFAFTEAIASWNASTPDGTWIETQIRAQLGGRWTKWYSLGIWAADTGTLARHSVRLQGDGDGYVAVDTLVLSSKKTLAEAYQIKLRLFSVDGLAIPSVKNLSVAYSTSPVKKPGLSSGNPALWNTLLPVPECSQMVYPDGGEVWCSPTSTSMVLGYWANDNGPCEPRVRAAVAGVYDWIYDGHGNWPFNTAYAATFGLEGYVARFTSLDKAEEWVKAGVPVVASIAWGKGDLTGAPIPSSGGHLLVIVGFDGNGNPIVNDPAAATNDEVQRTYLRGEFETQWLSASGGTVYLIFPTSQETPDL
jgi:Peptidase_C39 like family